MARTSNQVRVGDLELRVIEQGSGVPVLLVHGFLVDHREWKGVIPALAEHFRVVAPDLPGAGQSDKPPPSRFSYSWRSYADLLVQLLQSLEIDRCHLVGHSMGGGIAIAIAADYPQIVDRLVLIDSASYPFTLPLKARLPQLPGIGRLIFRKLYRRWLFHDYFRAQVFNGPAPDPAQVDAYYDDFSTFEGREAAYAALQTTLDVRDLPPRIPRIQAATRILWGAEDRVFPVRFGERLAHAIPNAELFTFPEVGHAPNEQQPDRTAELILGHLRT